MKPPKNLGEVASWNLDKSKVVNLYTTANKSLECRTLSTTFGLLVQPEMCGLLYRKLVVYLVIISLGVTSAWSNSPPIFCR